MTDHTHSHGSHGGSGRGTRNALHKDWRLWTAVIVMLLGMAAYVLSLDESIEPGGQPAQPMPAAE